MWEPKPKLKLVGEDGNVFAILGRAEKALRRAGAPRETIEQFRKEATSRDYNHVLTTCLEWFDHQEEEREEETK